jgi:uncharacterized protein (DUF2267 family)
MATMDVDDREQAHAMTAAVFHALRDRLSVREAWQARAQLPVPLKRVWDAGSNADRAPVKMHRREFYARVRRDADLRSERQARDATLAVFGALKEQLSEGESDDVLAQLPKDLKEIWTIAQAA